MEYVTIDNNKIQSFEYETTINNDGNISGLCELGKASIQLINESNEYSDFKDSWIHTVHGSFYIHSVKPVQEKINIKLECYDIKYKLDTPYDSSKHSFPCTLKEWRNSIFDDCKVQYDNSDFPNSDLILNVQPSLEENISNRNVIAKIAQAGLSIVITDSSDKFYFSWFTNTLHTVNDWIELTTEKNPRKAFNYFVLGRGDSGDEYGYPLEKPTNPVTFRIDNNYILDPQDTTSSEDQRAIVIIPLYNRINGFQFTKFSIRTTFIDNKLNIKLGDKIKYIDIWGNTITSYIMTKKIKWLSGDLSNSDNYEITLSADEIMEGNENVTYSRNDLKEKINVISRKADKALGKIEDLVQTTDENTEKIAQVVIENNQIKNTVSQNYQETNNNITETNKQLTQIKEDISGVNINVSNLTTKTQEIDGNIEKIEQKLDDMSYDFTTAGLKVGKSTDDNNTVLDNNGIRSYNKTELNAIFNKNGSGVDKLIVTGTAQIGYLKIKKTIRNSKKRTSIYHLEELIENLTDLED